MQRSTPESETEANCIKRVFVMKVSVKKLNIQG